MCTACVTSSLLSKAAELEQHGVELNVSGVVGTSAGTPEQGVFDSAFWGSIQKLSAKIVTQSHERGQQLAVQAQGIAEERREAYDGITDAGFKRVARRGF